MKSFIFQMCFFFFFWVLILFYFVLYILVTFKNVDSMDRELLGRENFVGNPESLS